MCLWVLVWVLGRVLGRVIVRVFVSVFVWGVDEDVGAHMGISNVHV